MATKDTVIVACKLPHGIIIEEERPISREELIMGGGTRTVTEWRRTGRRVVINGVGTEVGKQTMQRDEAGRPHHAKSGKFAEVLHEGYAITANVPADLWDHWVEANKDQPFVKNRLIFGHKQMASVRSQARDHEAQLSGLEGIDPDHPEKDFRNPALGIQRGESKAA